MEKRFFDSNFEVVLADTFESKLINYNIRYQVYCDEMGFEDKDVFPDEIEFDEWDKNSVHFLVRHKSSENWLGG
ncbi:MAG: GNAT family N-acetyltransferase, partial [Methylomonas sp.]|nr:GNAT family N-acetyltransferase [Methylomonas sp.]